MEFPFGPLQVSIAEPLNDDKKIEHKDFSLAWDQLFKLQIKNYYEKVI